MLLLYCRIISQTENYRFTGMKTALSQYLRREKTQGLTDSPKKLSSLTRQTCLVYYVLNQSTCFSCNSFFIGFMAATLVLCIEPPVEYIYVTYVVQTWWSISGDSTSFRLWMTIISLKVLEECYRFLESLSKYLWSKEVKSLTTHTK